MNEIAHIVSYSNAPWCGWLMFGLLLCALLSEAYQPGIITQAKNSLSAQTDRMYKESPATLMGQLLMGIFRIGIIAMAIYLCCTTEAFTIKGYGVIYGIALAGLSIKMLCHLFIDFTFDLSRHFGSPYEHYGNIVTLVTVLLYPVLLILMRVGSLILNRWLVGSIAAVFLLIWFYRSWKQFVNSPIAILYLLIYSFTLELLPWALLFIISDQIIAIL